MATKKAASTKKATAKKPAAAAKTQTTVRTLRADDKPAKKPTKPAAEAAVTKKTVTSKPAEARTRRGLSLPSNLVNVVFVELVGTFVLTLVALYAAQEVGALLVGLTYAALVLAISAVSGSHLNPAVTFGLWAMRRLKTALVPFYWGAQFLGAMLAVITINILTNGALTLSFDHLGTFNWSMFGVEFIGTLIFLFGLVAVLTRRELSPAGRALGIGLSLTVGLLVAGTLYKHVYDADVKAYQASMSSQMQSNDENADRPAIPHSVFANGATLNPAVALAAVEKTESQLTGGQATEDEKQHSRLSLEVILGTLAGAAVGSNLFLIAAGRRARD